MPGTGIKIFSGSRKYWQQRYTLLRFPNFVPTIFLSMLAKNKAKMI